ncbi:MAG: hypothetical protein HY744_03095 [Deltaproteobacteria bacterium]|nr:hypothetical protein [Deltaproteobacteria bacterium]
MPDSAAPANRWPGGAAGDAGSPSPPRLGSASAVEPTPATPTPTAAEPLPADLGLVDARTLDRAIAAVSSADLPTLSTLLKAFGVPAKDLARLSSAAEGGAQGKRTPRNMDRDAEEESVVELLVEVGEDQGGGVRLLCLIWYDSGPTGLRRIGVHVLDLSNEGCMLPGEADVSFERVHDAQYDDAVISWQYNCSHIDSNGVRVLSVGRQRLDVLLDWLTSSLVLESLEWGEGFPKEARVITSDPSGATKRLRRLRFDPSAWRYR